MYQLRELVTQPNMMHPFLLQSYQIRTDPLC